jgi:hypothetical protein
LRPLNADLVSTISLKRSTQNLQLSTSSPGRLPHLSGDKADSIWKGGAVAHGHPIGERLLGGKKASQFPTLFLLVLVATTAAINRTHS